MAEAIWNEKTLKLNSAKNQSTTTETAWKVAEKSAEELQAKLNEIEVKLAMVSSLVTTHEKELDDLKEIMKNCKQEFYNMRFRDTENSAGPVIFQFRNFGFMEGWMAVVNAIGLLDNSPYRDASQVPLPKDPPVDTQVDDQGEESEEEGDDSLGMRELSKQIVANVMVLDEENPSTVALTKA